jgi:hypothetical protein
MGNLSEVLPNENLLLDLTPSEVTLIRASLRFQQEGHGRNGFKALAVSCQDLRNKINDAMIESSINNKLSTVL